MKKRKRRLTRAAAAVLAILLAACVGLLVYSRNKNIQGETQKKIGAVYMTMNNPYFNVVNEKIKSVVRSRGDVMVTRDSALDSEMQNRQIEAFVQDGVDAILVNAVDWIKVEPALADARAAGIPVIAVPTSVGYGASFGGLSALLSMLNSCASGCSVVNIDNGFGAGFLASRINQMEGLSDDENAVS